MYRTIEKKKTEHRGNFMRETEMRMIRIHHINPEKED
jgi:hypothetical protein